MGRRPRSVGLELIQNSRSRRVTYEKRQKGLEKKAYELSTLCDVKIFMIVYGPKEDNDVTPIQPVIWPEEPDAVRNLISSLKNTPKEDGRSRRNTDISRFYQERTRHAQEQLAKLSKVNSEAKYPTWDEHYQTLSFAELLQYRNELDTMLDKMNTRIELMKITENFNYGESSMFNLAQGSQATQLQNNLFQRNNMELEIYQPQPQQQHVSSFNPFMGEASFHNFFDVNAFTNAEMKMTTMNNYGSSSSSLYNCDYAPVSSHVQYGAIGVNNGKTPFCYHVPGMHHLHSMPFQMPPHPIQSEPAPQMHDGHETEENRELDDFNLSFLLDPSFQMQASEMGKYGGDQMGNFNF